MKVALTLTELERVRDTLLNENKRDYETIKVISDKLKAGASLNGYTLSQSDIERLEENINLLSSRIEYQSNRIVNIKKQIYVLIFGEAESKKLVTRERSDKITLKNRVVELAQEKGYERGDTIPGRVINGIYQKVLKEGRTKSKNHMIVRSILNREGFKDPNKNNGKTDDRLP